MTLERGTSSRPSDEKSSGLTEHSMYQSPASDPGGRQGGEAVEFLHESTYVVSQAVRRGFE